MDKGSGKVKVIGAALAMAVLGGLIWLASRGDPAEEGPDDSGNMLLNPSFEQGEASWEWLSWSKGWAPFEISQGRRHTGKKALHLPVLSAGDPRRTIVWGVMQKVVTGDEFPECMDGWYLVSEWRRAARKQYLQAVIITNLKTESGADKQIRMVITGMDVPSYNLSNARYFFADKDKPVTPPLEEWVYFQLQPEQWFREAWGEIPPPGTELRVFYEARFDDRNPQDDVVAKVYFDDVYLGPKARGHCENER